MSRGHLDEVVLRAVRQLPEWIRSDLTAREPGTRARAEDALAARIAAALDEASRSGGIAAHD